MRDTFTESRNFQHSGDSRTKKRGLISSLCKGQDEHFSDKPCPHYDHFSNECILLKSQQIAIIWEQCRWHASNHKRFDYYKAERKWFERFKENYPDAPIDEGDIQLTRIIKSSKQGRIEKYTLNFWVRYILKAVEREMKRVLKHQGWLPRNTKECGACIYLSQSRPYICQKTGGPRKKGDEHCEKYRPNHHKKLLSIDKHEPNSDNAYETERLMHEISQHLPGYEDGCEKMISDKIYLEQLGEILAQRFNKEKPGSKKQGKYKRQCDFFKVLLHEIQEGSTKQDIENTFAKKYHVDPRTIRADIEEIRQFLEEKNLRELLK